MNSSGNLSNDEHKREEGRSDNLTPFKKRGRITWIQILFLLVILCLCFAEFFLRKSCNTLILLFFALWKISQKREILPVFIKDKLEPALSFLRKRFRALHIWLIRGKVEHFSDDRVYTCLGCGNSFKGNYCNCCGQSSRTARYRFSNTVKTFFEGATSINNRFLRTLLELLYRPGYMISDFIRGKRIVYVSPFQGLFLLAAFYIIVIQIIDPEVLNYKYSKGRISVKENVGETKFLNGNNLPESEVSKEKTYPAVIDLAEEVKTGETAIVNTDTLQQKSKERSSNKTVSSKILSGIRDYVNRYPFFQKTVRLLKRWQSGNKAVHIILLLPFFSFASFFVFRRKGIKVSYNLTEHFYIQTYIACQMLFLSIMMLLFRGKVTEVTLNDFYEIPDWLIFFIFCLDYKQIFRENWWNSFWHTLQFVVCFLLLILLLAAFIVFLLLVMEEAMGVIGGQKTCL